MMNEFSCQSNDRWILWSYDHDNNATAVPQMWQSQPCEKWPESVRQSARSLQRLPCVRGLDSETVVSPGTPRGNPPSVSRTGQHARHQPDLWRGPKNPRRLEKKKSKRCPPYGQRCNRLNQTTSWKWMNAGRSCANGRGNGGCGRCRVGGPVKSSRL